MTKSQLSSTHVANIAQSLPNLACLAKINQLSLI
jgi:hypothetical protein